MGKEKPRLVDGVVCSKELCQGVSLATTEADSET
ncbi:MAG: hypothetical protein RLZZ347_723 [Candidatus Parcubacteria bacterium]|jgi:hypothetical protein